MPAIEDIYLQHGVEHEVTDRGWVNTRCPHCGGSGMKLGFRPDTRVYFCWNCGRHRADDTLARLLGVEPVRASELLRSLGGGRPGASVARDRRVQSRVVALGYRRPGGTVSLVPSHARYLERRGFDPEKIKREWGVCSTGPVSRLDGIDYRNRLFIPITWDGRESSFQTRDVTGKSNVKYISCPPARELTHHKHVLYGRTGAWPGGLAIVVEGVTDAWRLGSLAAATFGVQLTPEQVRELGRQADRVVVVFDGERQAQRQAEVLVHRLRTQGLEACSVPPPVGQDPGSMSDDDAAHLVREIRRWGRQVQVPSAADLRRLDARESLVRRLATPGAERRLEQDACRPDRV